MYNPDHYYEQHMRHIKEMREQAAYDRMVAALAPDRPAGPRAALGRVGALRQVLGAWLTQPSEQATCTCGC